MITTYDGLGSSDLRRDESAELAADERRMHSGGFGVVVMDVGDSEELKSPASQVVCVCLLDEPIGAWEG